MDNERKSDQPESAMQDGIVLTEAQKKRQRERSIAIALALGILVVLFFAVTMVKGPAVLVRPL
jgi:1,4-dihydroxy-2-naphthoate octaprenyltransferase